MAKINHNNYLTTISDLIRDAKRNGILHLVSENDNFSGRKFTINGAEMINFGTCGYLGLEMDPRLINGAIDSVSKYGTQFSVSRTYLTSGSNFDLEIPLSQIYNGLPLVVSASTSSAHIANIPSLVRSTDMVIIDQQVHMSVQTGVQLAQVKGTSVEMVRHSNLDMLEAKIKEHRDKYSRIWYMADGVYSMYGDVAPIDDLIALTKKYEQFYLYVDDAHGMSWYGKNGAGYIFDKAGVTDNMILVTTLAKGFGVNGGITIFPSTEVFEKVKLFGGPLTYSHPIAPPLLGAAIASANIHLSPEIYKLQDELRDRTNYCNSLLAETSLPIGSDPLTPIFFIGMGQPKVGYNMVKRLMDDGFFLNIALFPAVPVKNTGLRFTLTRHIEKTDIKNLVDAMTYHYPRVLAAEGRTENDVRKAFHMPLIISGKDALKPLGEKNGAYTLEHYTDIAKISEDEWNSVLGDRGAFDWNAIKVLQASFSGNELPEDNWDFHYYLIRDEQKRPLLATFFTVGIFKDDLLAASGVSQSIENKRKTDPYYLTSKTIGMGCLVTEGYHLYLDRTHPDWKTILRILEDALYRLQDQTKSANILLRDFALADEEIMSFFIEEGFFKMDMPNSNIISGMHWDTNEQYLGYMSGGKARRHRKYEIFNYEHFFDVEIRESLSKEEVALYHKLYLNVKARNYAINSFPYPEKMFQTMSDSKGWEFVVLKLKPEHHASGQAHICAILCCYKAVNNYTFGVIGLDYDFVYTHGAYRQTLFQGIKRAMKLGYEKIFLGLSADIEKKKLGADQIAHVCYVQAKDNFNFELIEAMSVAGEAV